MVEDWRIDGGRRVPNKTDGNFYILNTNRMFEITQNYEGKQTFRFFDNPTDSRDGGAWMTIWDESVDNIINASDTDIGSNDVTLSVYPEADITQTPYDLTLRKENVAYVYPLGHNTNTEYSYLVYSDAAWDMIRILVDGDYADILLLLEENLGN